MCTGLVDDPITERYAEDFLTTAHLINPQPYKGEIKMGILDTTEHTLTCSHCKITETIKALDKGSMWDGSHWKTPESKSFDIKWAGGGKEEPSIVNIACKKCGATIVT